MANIVLGPQSAHGFKFLHRKDRQKKPIPADDMKKEVYHLHTLGRMGYWPVSAGFLKSEIREFWDVFGKKPNIYYTTGYHNNKSMGVHVYGVGYVSIQFRQGKREGLAFVAD